MKPKRPELDKSKIHYKSIFRIESLKQTKSVIEKDGKNKIIITNYQILPMITKNFNFAPNNGLMT